MDDRTDAAGEPRTVEEIAAETGFSVTTVRLVINGQAERYRISARTRQTIEAVVARHGYVLNHAARSLKLHRSDAIGLIVPDLANAYFARLTAAFEDHCRRRNLVLLAASTHEEPERERRTVNGLIARGVDGVIIAPCERPDPARFARRGRQRVATVVVDRDFTGHPFPTVVGDNEASARRLTERILAESGGEAFFLGARPEMPSIAARIRGFAAGLGGADPSGRVVTEPDQDTPEAGRALMRRLLDRQGGPPRAFISSSLLILEGALHQLADAFGRVPPATILGTFDHHPFMDHSANRVLSIRQNEQAIAAAAFARLDEQLDDRPPTLPRLTVIAGDLYADRARL